MKKKIAVTASGSNGSSNLPLALIFNNLHQLGEGIRKMERGVFYKFKDISGDDYWDCLTEEEKLLSYLCVEFLIIELYINHDTKTNLPASNKPR